MNKILRFAFVAAFAAVSSLSFAQKTVTFEAAKMQGPAKGKKYQPHCRWSYSYHF